MRALCILIGLLLATLALAQPDFQPPPPQQPENDDMQVLAEVMKTVETAMTALAMDTLTSKRLEKITGEGLIVAPFSLMAPEGGGEDEFLRFIITWTQEKMTSALIKADEKGHFKAIDRASIDKVAKVQKLDAKALADPKNWPAIGQAAGAKYLVTGAIGIIPLREHPLSLSFSLTTRIISVKDGRAVAAGSVDFVFPEKK